MLSEVLLTFLCGLMRRFSYIKNVLHLYCGQTSHWISYSVWSTLHREKVSFSYLMNRCLHNTAHPTDGSIISSHYGGLQEARDLCGRTERLTSSPSDRAHRGLLTRVVLHEKPKVEFPFYEVSSWCAGNSETCVKGSECQGPLSGHSTTETISRKVQLFEHRALVLFGRLFIMFITIFTML